MAATPSHSNGPDFTERDLNMNGIKTEEEDQDPDFIHQGQSINGIKEEKPDPCVIGEGHYNSGIKEEKEEVGSADQDHCKGQVKEETWDSDFFDQYIYENVIKRKNQNLDLTDRDQRRSGLERSQDHDDPAGPAGPISQQVSVDQIIGKNGFMTPGRVLRVRVLSGRSGFRSNLDK